MRANSTGPIVAGLSLLVLFTVPLFGAGEPIVGGPCEGCEAVFEGIPPTIGAETRIAPWNLSDPSAGEPMVLSGTVFGPQGRPAAGVIVYAYHTDARGIYPAPNGQNGAARRHGRLRGWARSDAQGGYRFLTVRPGSYPNRRIPAHVHLHVIEPGRATYWIDDVNFEDDPYLTDAERARLQRRGGGGVARASRDAAGVWQVRRDIVLGENVPGYSK